MTDLSSGTIADAIAATPPKDPPSQPEEGEVVRVILVTAGLFGFTAEEVLGPDREKRVVKARQVAIAVVRARTDLSWPQIGDVFDRDHSTCIHAAQRVMASPERLAWAAAVQAELDREET